MKKFMVIIFLLMTSFLFGDQYVNGYQKKDGTYVNGYYRSSPNSTKSDNFSTYGNVNPYTGEVGTKKYNDYNNYGNQNNSKNSNNYGYGSYGK